MSGCGLMWALAAMARPFRGGERSSLPRAPPLAWNVRTALRAKKGPARGAIYIRLPPLASREDEMDILTV